MADQPIIHLRDMLESLTRFDGQRLRVSGLFMRFHENTCLDATPSDDEQIAEESIHKNWRIWLDCDGRTKWIGFQPTLGQYLPVIADGLYRHGNCGHCGIYPGKLTEITSISTR